MRQLTSVLRYLVILFVLGFAARAYADDRAEARAHYQAGVKAYASADYRGAIREFSTAQQLVPADLNNYNLALCYDKLGDAEPAIRYYRAFLDKQPTSDKRAEIEASINRLEAASRSAASKRSDEARRADEARKADEAKRGEAPVIGPAIGPAAGGPGVARGGGPVVGPAPGPVVGPAPGPGDGPVVGPAPGPGGGPAAGALSPSPDPGAARRPGPAVAAPRPAATGDAQLDRVNAINLDEIRQDRVGGGAMTGPGGTAIGGSQPQPGPAAVNGASGAPVVTANDEPKKETAVYKKWWFWAIVGVSAYVVYGIATSSSSSVSTRVQPPVADGGLTLLRW
jgi:hypothetical protein